MDYDIIIHGKVITKDKETFKQLLDKALTDTNSIFKGDIIVYEFTESEKIEENVKES